MSSGRLQEGRAAAKRAYEEGNGLVALYLAVECVVQLEERIQELQEALRFYAAEENYRMSRIHGKEGYLYPVQDQDRGERARAALSREPSEATRSLGDPDEKKE